MERFQINIEKNNQLLHFEVADYMHHEDEHCQFEVYQHNQLVAGFEPDRYEYLRVCKNPGNIDKDVLHLIVDQLEALNL